MPRTVTTHTDAELAAIIRRGFWSGKLSVAKFHRIIRHCPKSATSLLRQFFTWIPSSVIVNEMGEKNFIKRWPDLRKMLNPDNSMERKGLQLFDSAWGIRVAGDTQYPVSKRVAGLSKGRKELLREVVCWPDQSIYGLAKKVNRHYTRVFKDIKYLVDQGLVEIRETASHGRKTSRLFSTESINTVLYDHDQRRQSRSE